MSSFLLIFILIYWKNLEYNKKLHLAIKNCICYNASRQKDVNSPMWTTVNENPEASPSGFSIPNFGNGKV